MIQEYKPYDDEMEPDSDELQRRIQHRQHHLSQTIDILGRELSPARLLERGLDESSEAALEKLSSTAQRTMHVATEKAKKNPWPVLLIGAGLIWWLSSNSNKDEKNT